MIEPQAIYHPLYTDNEKFIILITGGRGCETPTQEVIMSDLTVKQIKDIKVGDFVMGDDGCPRKVIGTMRGQSEMFRVQQTSAEDYFVNDAHIISLRKSGDSIRDGRYTAYPEFLDMRITDFVNQSKRFRDRFRGYKSNSIPYIEKYVNIEPYLLGVWLGDGTSMFPQVTTADFEIKDYLREYADRNNMRLAINGIRGNAITYRLAKNGGLTNPLMDTLREYNLISNKHIPQDYISNSENVRLDLLAGLIDTDGCMLRNGYEIIQKNEKLAKQIKYVADTLGFRTSINKKLARCNGKDCGFVYRVFINGDVWRIPCKISRKKISKDEVRKNKDWHLSQLSIESVGMAEKIVHQVLYTRYTMVSAGMSIIPEMMEKIELDGTTKYFKTTKTDIVNKMTNSRIMFRGIKTSSGNQTAKLKSIQGITTFVCDEAEEWTNEEEFDKIMLSIRKKGIQNRIIIIMNPCDSNHFIYKKYIENTHKLVEIDGVQVQVSTHPNVLHIHTTYFDNLENLSPEFLREVQEMKEKNPEKYAHVVIGRWADVAEGAVFKKWGIIDEFPQECKKVGLGLDFGFTNDPTAAIRCGVIDNRLYLDEVDYRTGLLSSDIVKSIRPWGLKTIADSADPRTIQEIHNGGVRIYAVSKYPGSVVAGIDKMKEYEIYITKRSYNLQREYRKYVWAKDKDGNYINEPEDHDNHGIDAARYWVLGELLGKIIKSQKVSKEELGIW